MWVTSPQLKWAAALCAALTVTVTGCGATIRSAAVDVPRAATPVVVDEGLKSLEDEKNQLRLAALLATPEMQDALRGLAATFARGAVSDMTSAEGSQQLAAATTVIADALFRAMEQRIATEGVALASSLSRAALGEAFTPANRRAMAATIASMTTTATRAAMRAAADEIPTTLGPAVRASISNELRSPDLNEAMASTARTVAREAIFGSRDALSNLQSREQGPTLQQRAMRVLTTTWVLAFLLGAIALGLLVWLQALRARTRRYLRDRAIVADLLTKTIKASEGKPWSAEMLDLVAEHFRQHHGESELLEREFRREFRRAPRDGGADPSKH